MNKWLYSPPAGWDQRENKSPGQFCTCHTPVWSCGLLSMSSPTNGRRCIICVSDAQVRTRLLDNSVTSCEVLLWLRLLWTKSHIYSVSEVDVIQIDPDRRWPRLTGFSEVAGHRWRLMNLFWQFSLRALSKLKTRATQHGHGENMCDENFSLLPLPESVLSHVTLRGCEW